MLADLIRTLYNLLFKGWLASASRRSVLSLTDRKASFKKRSGTAGNGEPPSLRQASELGIANAVKCGYGFIQQEPFLLMLGDNLIEGQLEPLIDSVLSDAAAASILLTPVSNPNLNAADSIFGDHVFLSGPSVQKEPGQYFLGDKSVLKMVNTDQQ